MWLPSRLRFRFANSANMGLANRRAMGTDIRNKEKAMKVKSNIRAGLRLDLDADAGMNCRNGLAIR